MELVHAAASLREVVARLALAAAIGTVVGVNRELQRQPAGLRTHALVALGGALMTIVALALPAVDAATSSASVSRVMQGIVAGIGFVGGGVVMYRGDPKGMQGLATAAAIWVVAAAGVAVGCGLWRTGLAAAVLTVVVLTGGEYLDRWLHKRSRAPE
jgi:putative Mg2+ transporter-C (MgtC) family protein